ncbi:glycoside hydrolase family 2 protein [Cohnella sp. GbtcB17]|uniref:glycoside hydrolase family 2 protein n=1 Tax=Cohnella sp. GbtcB17 TaxID=2824762 RepID=UPI001C310786|nr:sugar-binding domain-containing protein [Cohnella sp. GbtcB17]
MVMKLTGIGVNTRAGEDSEYRTVRSLDGRWRLQLDPVNAGMAEGWASRPLRGDWHCEVPGCIQKVKELGEAYPSVVGMPNAYLGTAWLETDFEVPELTDRRQLWLKCGGIAPAAHLWVNGMYVGYHAYAPVSAKWNITDMVRSGRSARVTAAIVEEDIGLLGGLRFGEVFWSGLYRSVEIETAGSVRIEELWLRPDAANGRLAISGCIYNDSAEPALLTPSASVAAWREEEAASAAGRSWSASGEAVEVGPDGKAAFALTVDMPDADRWSCEAPTLYVASVALHDGARPVDARRERFGLRDFRADGSALKLNGRPFLARGTGQEYFSPTISPLTDRGIIRQRWYSLREHGFNFFRCHTYTPTPEELETADELGILLVSEIGLVSNFGGTFPFAEAADVLAAHVAQTRNHPSLAVYCLGNEGSQLMVHRQEDRERAEAGYRIIKRHAPDHVGMIAFGMQGELPDLPNDAESPHLWGHEFRLAYDGLSRIPWRLLDRLASEKPTIVHEYGKFGVWPDPREETVYPPNGYAASYGRRGGEALAAAGMAELEAAIVHSSRALSHLCTRTSIEMARRQPGMDGYVMWTFFRHGNRNAGLADDMGLRGDTDPSVYREGCNAPLAVLIDRDYEGRTLRGGAWISLGIHLSNYSGIDVRSAAIAWRFATGDGSELLAGRIEGIGCPDGANGQAGAIEASLPDVLGPEKLTLSVRVLAMGETGERELAANSWPFWAFPSRREKQGDLIVCDFADRAFGLQFRAHVPGAVQLADYDSMLRGCRSWTGPDAAAALDLVRPSIYVTDRLDETCRLFLARGVPALLLGGGSLPADWLPPLHPPGPMAFQYHRQFTSFRAGWDRGNIATLVHADPVLGDFPHDGWCDAQFYGMIQDADPLRVQAVARDVGAPCRTLIRSVPRLQTDESNSVVLQDPNARNVQKKWVVRHIATEERAYLLRADVDGTALTICSLRLFDDPAGEYLLTRLLRHPGRTTKEESGQ